MLSRRCQSITLYPVLRWSIVVAFSIMVLSTLLQVITRYALGSPQGWTEELARIMLYWTTFLAIPLLIRGRRIIRIDAFLSQVSPALRAFIEAMVHIFCAFVLLWLCFHACRLVVLAQDQPSAALQVPYALIYLSAPVGLLCAVGYSVQIACLEMRNFIERRKEQA